MEGPAMRRLILVAVVLIGTLAPFTLPTGPLSLAAQEATPNAEPAVLFTGTLPDEELPGEAGPVYVARATYTPGASEDWDPDNGLTLAVIERGALTITVQGPATLLGRGRAAAGEAAPGARALTFQAGEGIRIPSGTGATVVNDGTEEARVIFIGLYPAAGFVPLTPVGAEAPHGEEGWPLLGKGSPQQPPVASTVTIERLQVALGETVSPLNEQGMAVVVVEAGAIRTIVEQGLAEASSAAFLRTGAVGPGAAFVGPGQERRIRTEGSLFVQPGTVLTLHNDGDEPTILLVVRLSPITNSADATPDS